jgi:peptidoglycan/LPS O-acetylase OafA/YrhL
MRLAVDVPLRLLAILAVVVLHATNWPVGGGAFLLTILAGVSLARFQRARLLEGRVLPVAAAMLLPVLSAYFAVLGPLALYFDVDWRWFALVANLGLVAGDRIEPAFLLPYWYVATYAQDMVLLCLPFAVPAVRRAVRDRPFAAALVACAVTAALLALVPVGALEYRVQLRHPLGALQLMAVGWLIAVADTTARRAVASAAAVVSWALLWRDADPAVVLALVPGALALIWGPPLAVPLGLGRTMVRAAALTLHIYVAHVPALYVARHVLDAPVQILAVTLVLSVIVAAVLRAGLQVVTHGVLALGRRGRAAGVRPGARSAP